MAVLEELQPSASVRGIIPDGLATVVNVEWYGSDEMTQHLIRPLESGGEQAAGEFAAKLGSQAEAARDLAYRFYVVSERKRRAADALAYNGLVQSWPEIVRIAGEQRATTATQGALELDGA